MPRDLFSQSVLAVALLILALVPGANAQKDDRVISPHRLEGPVSRFSYFCQGAKQI